MQRIAGACLVVASFVYAGLYILKSGREHICELKELCAALALCQAELSLRLSSLEEITALLASKEGKYAPAFFKELNGDLYRLGEVSFERLWAHAVKKSLNGLEREELESMKRLGTILGSYELTEQLKAIELCREELDGRLKYWQSRLVEQERTCIGICSALGVMLAVVLM